MSTDFVNNLVAIAGNGFVELQWDDTGGQPVNIYRSTEPFITIVKRALNQDVGVNNGATLFDNGKKVLYDGTLVHVIWRDFSGDIVYTKSSTLGDTFLPRTGISAGNMTPKPVCYFPNMALDRSGNIHAVWSANYQDIYDVYYSNNISGTFSNPIKVSSGGNYSTMPSIDVSADGTVYIAYEDIKPDTFTSIYVATVNNGLTGAVVSKLEMISGTNEYIRYKNPCLAVDKNSIAHVMWIGDDFTNRTIFYNYNALGKFAVNPYELFANTIKNVSAFNMVADAYGNLYLSFANRSLTDNTSEIKFSVNQYGSGFETPVTLNVEKSLADLPFIILDDDGDINDLKIYILWEDNYTDNSGASVFYALFTLPDNYEYLGVFYDGGRNVKGISGVALPDSKLGCIWTEFNAKLVPEFNVVFVKKHVGDSSVIDPSVTGILVNPAPVTTNSYIDNTVKNGITYYYITKIVGSTVFSLPVAATPYYTQTVDPPVPSNFMAMSSYGGVRLSWDKMDLGLYGGYNVYRMVGKVGNTFIKIADTITSSDYFDMTVTAGATYTYGVTLLDKSTPPNESAYSNKISLIYVSENTIVVNSPFILYGKVIVSSDSDLQNVQVSVYDQRNHKITVGILDTVDGYYVIDLANEDFQWSIGDVVKVEAVEGSGFGSDYTYAILSQSPQVVKDLNLVNRVIGDNVAVKIQQGSLVTTTSITLAMTATNATSMIVSENSNFIGAAWEQFEPTKILMLTPSDGNKTVYARYKDSSGNLSKIVSDSTVLDTTAPVGVGFFIREKSPVSNLVIHIVFVGEAHQLIVSEFPDFKDTHWKTFVREMPFTLSNVIGTKIIYVKFRDVALNETAVFEQSIVYLLLPGKPMLIDPLDGDVSDKPRFSCTVNEDVGYSIQYELEFSRNEFRTVDNTKDQSLDSLGWLDKYGNNTSSYSGIHTAIYQMPDYRDGYGMNIGDWQWRARAKNRYGYGPYSDPASIHIGLYDGSYNDNYPHYTIRYADTGLTGIDYWTFFLMKQLTAYVYWSNGEIHLPQGVYRIVSNDRVPVDPTLYPASTDLPVTADGEWWMVLKWRSDINAFTIGNASIKFCDHDKLADLLRIDNNWIPVLYFPTGVEYKVPAVGSSVLSYSQDSYPIDNKLNINDMVLLDHINNVSIHAGIPFNLPFNGLGRGSLHNPTLFTINNLTQDVIYSRGITAKAYGIGMAGVSSKEEFTGINVDGIGLFAQGDAADVMMKNGSLYSLDGSIKIGSDDIPLSVVLNNMDDDGVIGNNISDIGDSSQLPSGIRASAIGIGGVGMSNYVGAMGRGSIADIMLRNSTVLTKDGNGNLIVNGDILNRFSLLKGKNI